MKLLQIYKIYKIVPLTLKIIYLVFVLLLSLVYKLLLLFGIIVIPINLFVLQLSYDIIKSLTIYGFGLFSSKTNYAVDKLTGSIEKVDGLTTELINHSTDHLKKDWKNGHTILRELWIKSSQQSKKTFVTIKAKITS
jgi:hypothetical protein